MCLRKLRRSIRNSDLMPEAKLIKRKGALVPKGEGWYILNAKKAAWGHTEEFGSFVTFRFFASHSNRLPLRNDPVPAEARTFIPS